MRRILLIAKRDYLAAIKAKAFLIGLIVAPIMFGGGFIGVSLMKKNPDLADRKIAVVDRSGVAAATLIRTAEAIGVHGVVIPLAHTVEVTPAVVNASSGASEHLRVARSNLAQAIDALKAENVWVVGLDQNGEAIGEKTQRHLTGAVGLVVGSEGEGIRQLTRAKCDIILQLPMRGQIESLNAAVAGSVALYLAYLARIQS